MKSALYWIFCTAVIFTAGFWFLTAPKTFQHSTEFEREGNVENGRTVFFAGGCMSCHSAPGATGDDKLVLAGGLAFPSPFGTFFAPNISPDANQGIGSWSNLDLANALIHGTSPNGQHYYPAFPYSTYTRAKVSDIIDLRAFLNTLPSSAAPNKEHELPLAFRIRRGLGLWKLLHLKDASVMAVSDSLERGRYLVEGLGHCAECHTPRDATGGLRMTNWMAGAPSPDGKGRVPNITPHADGLGSWSLKDIEYYFESGFTPDFDTAGGAMAEVVENLGKLSKEDLSAIAMYVKMLPPIAGK